MQNMNLSWGIRKQNSCSSMPFQMNIAMSLFNSKTVFKNDVGRLCSVLPDLSHYRFPPFVNNTSVRLWKDVNSRKQTKRRMLPAQHMLLLDKERHQPKIITRIIGYNTLKTTIVAVSLKGMMPCA